MANKGVTNEEMAQALQLELEFLNKIMKEEIRLSFNELYAMMKYLKVDIITSYSYKKRCDCQSFDQTDMEKELIFIAKHIPMEKQSKFMQGVRILADTMTKEEETTF